MKYKAPARLAHRVMEAGLNISVAHIRPATSIAKARPLRSERGMLDAFIVKVLHGTKRGVVGNGDLQAL